MKLICVTFYHKFDCQIDNVIEYSTKFFFLDRKRLKHTYTQQTKTHTSVSSAAPAVVLRVDNLHISINLFRKLSNMKSYVWMWQSGQFIHSSSLRHKFIYVVLRNQADSQSSLKTYLRDECRTERYIEQPDTSATHSIASSLKKLAKKKM